MCNPIKTSQWPDFAALLGLGRLKLVTAFLSVSESLLWLFCVDSIGTPSAILIISAKSLCLWSSGSFTQPGRPRAERLSTSKTCSALPPALHRVLQEARNQEVPCPKAQPSPCYTGRECSSAWLLPCLEQMAVL